MGKPARFRLKVRHYESDAYGHVNHANYIHYLEVARLEALEALGIPLQEIWAQGYRIVATDLSVHFHSSAGPGETLEIITRIRELKGVRSVWVQEMRDLGSQRLRVTAEVTGVFTTEDGRPVRIPPGFRERLVALHAPDAQIPGENANPRLT